MKKELFTPGIREGVITFVLIVLPFVLGYLFKALDLKTDYYMPTLLIGWAVLLLTVRLENRKILDAISEERRTYQGVLNQLSDHSTENLGYLKLLTKHGAIAKVNANQMAELWREACETIAGKYAATNYIDPNAQFGSLANAALTMQHAHYLNDHAKIQKIFIHDDKKEMETWITNENQCERHIRFTELRHVIVEDLARQLPNDFKEAANSDAAKAIVREMDFAVFNDLFLLEWELDKARRVTGGSLVWDKKKVEERKALFSRMWQVAIDHNIISKGMRNTNGHSTVIRDYE